MIRAASEADIPAILAIWNPMIRDALITFNSVEKTADDLRVLLVQKAHEGHAFLVAERDGVAVGFATYRQFRSDLGYRHTVEHSIMPGDAARARDWAENSCKASNNMRMGVARIRSLRASVRQIRRARGFTRRWGFTRFPAWRRWDGNSTSGGTWC